MTAARRAQRRARVAALREARGSRELRIHGVPLLEGQGFLHLACDSIHRWRRWVDQQGP